MSTLPFAVNFTPEPHPGRFLQAASGHCAVTRAPTPWVSLRVTLHAAPVGPQQLATHAGPLLRPYACDPDLWMPEPPQPITLRFTPQGVPGRHCGLSVALTVPAPGGPHQYRGLTPEDLGADLRDTWAQLSVSPPRAPHEQADLSAYWGAPLWPGDPGTACAARLAQLLIRRALQARGDTPDAWLRALLRGPGRVPPLTLISRAAL